MDFYERFVLPRLLAWAMRQKPLVPYRQRAAGSARGRVLELGIGSGCNLPFYGPDVHSLIGIDPSRALLDITQGRRSDARFPLDLLQADAADLPLEAHSIDTVLTTWTLCSVGDPLHVLSEARRVLKPDGRLIFVEHGRAPDAGVRRWQDRITPAWRRIAGGCHLNRPVDTLVAAAGFTAAGLRTGYMRGPRIATFMYEGEAAPR
ncbi:MAG TPA: class I SAM-dependent methyltransferase [Acetobacteraceae bacterium]|nr:class I SAM-dependent methyltransferase [Acetobacteraceae bacterium]